MLHYNFGAGPSQIPHSILKKIKSSFKNWDKNLSILDTNHKSKAFFKIHDLCELMLIDILKIPNQYQILFLPSGARNQFSMIPNNIICKKAYYLISGIWSDISLKIAKRYLNVEIVGNNNTNKYTNLPYIKYNKIKEKNSFLHYCDNETINGIEFNSYIKNNIKNIPIISDMSSNFLSKNIDINNFDLLYACSQKNLGIPGLTIVIMNKNLFINNNKYELYNYSFWIKKKSIYNTPSILCWYICYLMLKWIKSRGSLYNIEKYNLIKSNLLYNYIDNSNFYFNYVNKKARSRVNVPFFLKNCRLNKKFLFYANKFNLYNLKGHILAGGMRANLYNSMTIKGVKKLIYFMQYFKKKHRLLF